MAKDYCYYYTMLIISLSLQGPLYKEIGLGLSLPEWQFHPTLLLGPSGGTHHGGAAVADEGWLGAQVLFVHDAGRGDGERRQVEGKHHGEEGTENGHLGGCRHGP